MPFLLFLTCDYLKLMTLYYHYHRGTPLTLDLVFGDLFNCLRSIVHWGNFISSSIVFFHGQVWLILLILFPLFLLGLLIVCLGASVCSMYCAMSLFAAVIVCFYF